MVKRDDYGALVQMRAFLAQTDHPPSGRLPTERELSEQLGVTRSALRKALATLEAEGRLWRHVGKGTFVGTRPIEDLSDIVTITKRTNPAEVMRTRLLIEPEIARLAALDATAADIDEMRTCMSRSRSAANWRQYENWDNRLHRVITESTRNALLLALFDTLNAVRRAVSWGRLRANKLKPDPNHHSFAEHQAVVEAIAERDMERAAHCMRGHLETVERNLLRPRAAAE